MDIKKEGRRAEKAINVALQKAKKKKAARRYPLPKSTVTIASEL